MDVKRQPLQDANRTSRLPMPGASKLPRPGAGSRLPQPASKLAIPRAATKRARSPEPVAQPTTKKAKVDTAKARPLTTTSRTNSRQVATSRPAAPKGDLEHGASSTARPTTTTNRPGMKRNTSSSSSISATAKPGMKRNNSSSSSISAAKTNSKPTAAKSATSKPSGGASKRPAWDLKGRLQDMEELMMNQARDNQELMSQILNNGERVQQLESNNTQLKNTVVEKEEITHKVSREIDDLERKLRNKEDEFVSTTRTLQRELEDLQFSKSSLQRQKNSLEGELGASQEEVSGLKSTVAQLNSAQAGIKAELSSTKLILEQSVSAGHLKDGEIAKLKALVAQHEATAEELNSKLREEEGIRRKLHNTIQELKGNIRVFCRVRPLLGDETVGNDGIIGHINYPDDDEKTIALEKPQNASLDESTMSRKGSSNTSDKGHDFVFDRVFQPSSTQGEVFEEIQQLVQSALDGYNVCIFAYGQTGSGKTHTMEGPDNPTKEDEGMIPRAVSQVFESGRNLEEKGWVYEYEASFVEIYNETIRDLLGNGKDDLKHDIKHTGSNSSDVMVTNLTTIIVKSESKVNNLLKKASDNRAVAETKCNERSSRSHSVFRLKITGKNDITGEGCQGTLNLIDLAGSERLKDSGSSGARLKETQAINKSLSNLGNVIMALGNKEPHIPYRNSKLTYLLQNSLGGNSKTLMFVNVSPKEDNFNETLNSLRFATKVNQCNIGTATKKVK